MSRLNRAERAELGCWLALALALLLCACAAVAVLGGLAAFWISVALGY